MPTHRLHLEVFKGTEISPCPKRNSNFPTSRLLFRCFVPPTLTPLVNGFIFLLFSQPKNFGLIFNPFVSPLSHNTFCQFSLLNVSRL